MAGETRQTEEPTPRLTQQEQALQLARGLVERSSHLLANGVSDTLTLIWEWLWAEAGFKPGTITIRAEDLARERGKLRQAVGPNLEALRLLELCPIVEGKPGRGGGTLIAVEDPFEVFTDAPRRVEASNQNEFHFVAELAAEAEREAEQRIRDAEPAVVAIGLGSVKRKVEDALPCIIEPDPKCKVDTNQPCILEVESGDHTLLPALFVERVEHALGSEACDLWLRGCRYEWQAPELKLYIRNEFTAATVRKTTAPTLREIGRSLEAGFRLEVLVEPGGEILNARHWPPSLAFENVDNARLTAQRTNNVCSEVYVSKTSEQTNERNEPDLHLKKKAGALLQRAVAIFNQIDDDRTLFPWVAIDLALQVDDGKITEAQLTSVIDAFRSPDSGGSPTKCFKAGGVRFRGIRAVKIHLKHGYDIPWTRKFEHASEKKR